MLEGDQVYKVAASTSNTQTHTQAHRFFRYVNLPVSPWNSAHRH